MTLTAPAATPLTVTGGGVLAVAGMSQFANGINVTNGSTLAFGSVNSTAFLGDAQVNLAAGTTLDARGVSGTIGSLTGSGTVTNSPANNLTAGTVITGFDNTSTTFSGAITNPFVL